MDNNGHKDKLKMYKTAFLDESGFGKGCLYDLLKSCYFTGPTYKPGVSALDLAFAEGRRSVVLDILKILEMSEEDVTKFIRLQEERNREVY